MGTKYFGFFVLIVFCGLAEALDSLKNNSKPNFIIIYTDDMGYSDAGPFGNPLIETPAIDSLVKTGQTWTNFYAAASVCTPSRGALLTGKLPVRTGLYGNNLAVFYPGSRKGIPHDEKTIAEVFHENHYRTGIFGKWHLGDAPDYYPTRHGFDEWLGIPYSNDMDWEVEDINISNFFIPPEEINTKWGIVAPKLQKKIYRPNINDWQVPLIYSQRQSNGVYSDVVLERPADQSLITQRYTNESIRFIRESVSAKNPFFLYLSHNMPHVPLFRSPGFAGKSRAGLYGDVIEEVDWSVDRITATLKELAIDEHTYIVFTSDNGPWLIYKDHAGSAKPLRNGKSTTFEGGMRVMTVFSGPSIKPGQVKDLGMQTDLFATFSQLAGFDRPDTAEDSYDLTETLKHHSSGPRNFIPFYSGSELRAFRHKDHKIHYVTQGAYGMPPKREVHDSPLLIDLVNDIGETTNIAQDHTALTAQILGYAEELKKSVVIKPSIVDSQSEN